MKWSGLTAIGYTSTRTLATLSVIGLMFYHYISLTDSKFISFKVKIEIENLPSVVDCQAEIIGILTLGDNTSALANKIFQGIECSRLTLNLFHVFALFSFCEWHKKILFFLDPWRSKNSSSILHSNQKIRISFLEIFVFNGSLGNTQFCLPFKTKMETICPKFFWILFCFVFRFRFFKVHP